MTLKYELGPPALLSLILIVVQGNCQTYDARKGVGILLLGLGRRNYESRESRRFPQVCTILDDHA